MGVSFCPGCGVPPEFVQEFWVASDRHFLCWCAACGMLSTVVLAAQLVSHEPEH